MQPVRLRALGAALLTLALLVPVALAADRNGGPGPTTSPAPAVRTT
jgi:hypothetical protein